jgi:hypothetical protein
LSAYDEDNEEDDGAVAGPDSSLTTQLARKLVRYALSSEFSRTPIRRTDIVTRVLGQHSRQFRAVFAEAQNMLRDTFGMEMVELPRQDKVTLQQRRGAGYAGAGGMGTC